MPYPQLPWQCGWVSYLTGPKRSTDQTVMPQRLGKTRGSRPLPNERRRVPYTNNCSEYDETDHQKDASEHIRIYVAYFPQNATHLAQPCDSLTIQWMKRACTTHWETYSMNMAKVRKWKEPSGQICIQKKFHFLQSAARSVREVNWQRDENELTHGSKAMIIKGMALNTNG